MAAQRLEGGEEAKICLRMHGKDHREGGPMPRLAKGARASEPRPGVRKLPRPSSTRRPL